jgi:hypothetical protein
MPDTPTSKNRERKRKSQIVSVRLDPQLKYLAELAARKQRRPLSSFIEWAIENVLNEVSPAPTNDPYTERSFNNVASELWDVDEPDRFVKLAFAYPDLLDHEEQRLWKILKECGLIWRGRYGAPDYEWQWDIQFESLIWKRLREHWDIFCAVAAGDLPESELPTWQKTKPAQKGGDDLDDEIPF